MKQYYYLFNPGRLSRKDNTLQFIPVDSKGKKGKPRYVPVTDTQGLYVFGSLDANSSLYNFLGKQAISVHFFDYYEHYTGSFMPKEYLLAGKVQVAQTRMYTSMEMRMPIAQKILEGAVHNLLKNLKYYLNRGRDVEEYIYKIMDLSNQLYEARDIPVLMGVEGNIRQTYYQSFGEIISGFQMGKRTMQPPDNEINALISFGNMLCYALCLDMIYHTQLNPTISFLHEPGARRYSLALDLAEVFKPLLVDRLIFKLLNTRQIQARDFDKGLGRCMLREGARNRFVQAWDTRIKEVFQHRKLGRKVSYRHAVKLECYKLIKHILEIDTYEPFKIWW